MDLRDRKMKTNGTEVEEDKAKESMKKTEQDYIEEGERIQY